MGRAAAVLRALVALAALSAAAVAGLLIPVAGSPVAAGLAVAVLAAVVLAVVSSVPVAAALRPMQRARIALERAVPRSAQSDPDARGHARPRAPGCLLPAV